MASKHLSIRIEASTLDELDSLGSRTGATRSEVAKRLLEEGLRMEDHPGIVFRSGPAGRRPGLSDGPDVWEIVQAFLGTNVSGEAALRETAEVTGQGERQVRTALGYYAEFKDEIDAWIRRVQEEARRAETAWRREHLTLQR